MTVLPWRSKLLLEIIAVYDVTAAALLISVGCFCQKWQFCDCGTEVTLSVGSWNFFLLVLPFLFPLSHQTGKNVSEFLLMFLLARVRVMYRCGELLCKAHLHFPLCFEGVGFSFTNTSFLLRKAMKYVKATLPFSTKNLKPCYATGLNQM